jgi:uracil-DNA glycosylase family 4
VAVEKRRAYADWDYWGNAVPGFGDPEAELVIIGLAPAAHGANRTGRMFTGDSSGDTLTAAMYRVGFANQARSDHRDDGLTLSNAYLTAVARCAPPGNRPTADELTQCRQFLIWELELLTRCKVVLVLGQIAMTGYLRVLKAMGVEFPRLDFQHGGWYSFDPPVPELAISYHPSRQNTQTGRLTTQMLDDVFMGIRRHLDAGDWAGLGCSIFPSCMWFGAAPI